MRFLFGVLCVFLLSTSVFAQDMQDFVISRGATPRRIAAQLKEQGLISNSSMFLVLLKVKGADRNLRAGTFQLSSTYSVSRIIRILQEKEGAASLTKVTIPEGFTLSEIAKRLYDAGIISDAKGFVSFVNTHGKSTFQSEFSFIEAVPTTNLEGYLFPNTYVFVKGSTNEQVMRLFLKEFESQLMPIWREAPHPYSLHNTLVLASIIEKEAYGHDEMTRISGVYHNRLRRSMKLDSCPTVAYGMGQPRKKFLTYKDLKYPSIYNTYRRKGIPPTPIAAPGKHAFYAALYPEKTSYLYFVANGDGSHTFTRTLKQHLDRQQVILLTQ